MRAAGGFTSAAGSHGVGAPEGQGGPGDPSGCNPSALVSWERRVRPAPCVKNSGAAGATASSCCWKAGAASPPGPRFGDRTGSRRGTGGEPTGPGNACAIFRGCVRAFPARGPGCEGPDRGAGGFQVRGSRPLPAPGLGTRTPHAVSKLPGPRRLRRNPPAGAPRTPLQLGQVVGGRRGALPRPGRGPGPRCLSRWVLQAGPPASASSPSGPARPAPGRGGARPRPVQPRPGREPRGPRPEPGPRCVFKTADPLVTRRFQACARSG